MGTVQSAQAAMHYKVPSLAFEACRNCGLSVAQPDGLRCGKGGFWVAPIGGCKEWLKVEPAPAKNLVATSIGVDLGNPAGDIGVPK